MKTSHLLPLSFLLLYLLPLEAQDGPAPRARDLGIPFAGAPGPHNAITDVPGVRVGYATLIEGEGRLDVGKGPVRTGVTVVLPAPGFSNYRSFPAAVFSLNGMGEMTAGLYLQDYPLLYGPVGITNTNSVGVVRDAIGKWLFDKYSTGGLFDFSFGLPVAAETWDGVLNDINGLHVRPGHVFAALDNAQSGRIAEGNVGGGTGMVCYEFKGGTGTSSRRMQIDTSEYTLGVLVQANFGRRPQLAVAGVPVGEELPELMPELKAPMRSDGSIIAIVATDAPLLPWQLQLVAKRVSLGIARTGSYSSMGSGDIFLAFSTAEKIEWNSNMDELDALLNPIFLATVEATEEAIVNAMVAAQTMTGINGNTIHAIPHGRLREIMREYNRLKE
ncbi:MAG: P1 family peptidase [Phaeodactylibacter sp.]|nr:P1 family peptidase [Phaeodactylibacter sp.]